MAVSVTAYRAGVLSTACSSCAFVKLLHARHGDGRHGEHDDRCGDDGLEYLHDCSRVVCVSLHLLEHGRAAILTPESQPAAGRTRGCGGRASLASAPCGPEHSCCRPVPRPTLAGCDSPCAAASQLLRCQVRVALVREDPAGFQINPHVVWLIWLVGRSPRCRVTSGRQSTDWSPLWRPHEGASIAGRELAGEVGRGQLHWPEPLPPPGRRQWRTWPCRTRHSTVSLFRGHEPGLRVDPEALGPSGAAGAVSEEVLEAEVSVCPTRAFSASEQGRVSADWPSPGAPNRPLASSPRVCGRRRRAAARP